MDFYLFNFILQLSNYFKDDKTISFCYSADQNDENDDAKILYNFSNK